MKIDVTDILSGRTSFLDFEYSEGMPDDKDVADMLPPSVKIPDGGIKVCGRITDTGGCMSLSAKVFVQYTAPCDRCLEKTSFSFEFELYRVISAAASPEDRERDISENEEKWDGVTEDLIYVSDGRCDLTADIAEAISLEFPMQNLCSEDCPGLCPVCGKKLGDSHSGCQVKKEIDPRLAILQKLLENSDE